MYYYWSSGESCKVEDEQEECVLLLQRPHRHGCRYIGTRHKSVPNGMRNLLFLPITLDNFSSGVRFFSRRYSFLHSAGPLLLILRHDDGQTNS
jgi:hypothetical protein